MYRGTPIAVGAIQEIARDRDSLLRGATAREPGVLALH